MRDQLREEAVKLRADKRLSYGEIQKKLNVPKSTLSYWLQDYPLNEKEILKFRQAAWLRGEVSRERFRNSMKKRKDALECEIYSYQKKKLSNLKKESFFIGGLMLYLGEGDKKNKNRVGLANTDPAVIKFFIKWLQDFFSVPKNMIRAELHLYENMNIKAEKLFWKKVTGFPVNQFYKDQIRKIEKRKFNYREPQRHGTCSIILASSDKKREIMITIKAFLDLYLY